MTALVALLALLTEALLGYPNVLVKRIGHPVIWLGRLIGWLDRMLNRETMGGLARRAMGILAIVIIVAVAGGIALALERSLMWLPFGFVLVAILASTLIAQRGLHDHVARVAVALETEGLAAGREAVSHIVGRDTDVLDEAGVVRGAIESLAENFSDGVVAPTFWTLVLGLPGGAAYKAINTADSMLGHRSPRHLMFGWASARLDDLVNLPASRLSAFLLISAAATLPQASAGEAFGAVLRDASRHRSPNAGYPEAALAGALNFALAGPRVYGGKQEFDGYMGEGRRDLTAADIRASLALYRRADAIMVALVGAVALLVIGLG